MCERMKLEIRNLSKTYPNGVKAMQNVSLSICKHSAIQYLVLGGIAMRANKDKRHIAFTLPRSGRSLLLRMLPVVVALNMGTPIKAGSL